ncbi:MAG: response regulator transcription factor [Bacteroidales bacterium]|nr:response regulator transcription factor [Bacteroidales bacterium]
MKNHKIVVNIPSFLLRKAVLSVLYENFSATDVVVIDAADNNNLTEIMLREQPDIILLQNTKIPFDDLVFKDIYFVAITDNETQVTKNEFLDEVLMINDSQSTIIHKLQKVINKIKQPHSKNTTTQELSDREKEILKAVAQGLTNQEIAEKLFLSIHTITTHRKNITAKLGIKTISGLTLYALLNGLVNLEETKLI